jgi:hypothetical protein
VVAGWSAGDLAHNAGEPPLDPSERNNALSIVVRFEYAGHSVLLTGDTVGRPLPHLQDVGTPDGGAPSRLGPQE